MLPENKNEKLNVLGDALIQNLKEKKDFFATTYIAFPSKDVESWFKTYWLKTQDDVLANVEYGSVDKILLAALDIDRKYTIVKHSTLRDLTIKYIIEKRDELITKTAIYDYCDNKGKIDPAKLYDIANELSKLFIEYDDCKMDLKDGWQKTIYDAVMEECMDRDEGTLYAIYKKSKGFKTLSQPIQLFGIVSLSKCQEALIEECRKSNEVITYKLIKDTYIPNKSVFAAPSKLREIEIVHSKICGLLKDKNVALRDILVVAPDMSEYETHVNRVFKQDGVEFPSIPYSVTGSKRDDSDVTGGIKTLFDIAIKGFCTRADFLSLISNKAVMQARDITQDDIDNWSTSVINMNVFRDSESHDDWDYAKKRVLLAKLAPCTAEKDVNAVSLEDGKYLPFSNINFDNDSITKFYSLIDDIKEWESIIKNNEYVSKDTLNSVLKNLDKWFKGDEEDIPSRAYRKARNVIYHWLSIDSFDKGIPFNTLMYSLFDASMENTGSHGQLFVRGVTFMTFNPGTVLSAKYIFFLGASSSATPRQYIKSEIDIREDNSFDKSQVERDTFFAIGKNAAEQFIVSFVNKDLKTDEDFYPSTLIQDMGVDLEKGITFYPIDETRSWGDLYTRKEYKDKNYYDDLLKTKETGNKGKDLSGNVADIKRVKASDMADFLNEPLMHKAKRILGKEYYNDEKMEEEYEPFEMDRLVRSPLITKVIKSLIDRKVSTIDDAEKQKISEELELERSVPLISGALKVAAIEDVIKEAKTVKDYLDVNYTDELSIKYSIKQFGDVIFDDADGNWVLTCDKEVIVCDDDNGIAYLEPKEMKTEKVSDVDFLALYVYSLMDVALRGGDSEYSITLRKSEKNSKQYTLNAAESREILKNIYEAMCDENDYVAKPMKVTGEITSKAKLIDNLMGESGVWRYFNDKNLFDKERDFCPDYDDFEQEYKDVFDKHKSLIKYMMVTVTEEVKE